MGSHGKYGDQKWPGTCQVGAGAEMIGPPMMGKLDYTLRGPIMAAYPKLINHNVLINVPMHIMVTRHDNLITIMSF